MNALASSAILENLSFLDGKVIILIIGYGSRELIFCLF